MSLRKSKLRMFVPSLTRNSRTWVNPRRTSRPSSDAFGQLWRSTVSRVIGPFGNRSPLLDFMPHAVGENGYRAVDSQHPIRRPTIRVVTLGLCRRRFELGQFPFRCDRSFLGLGKFN